MPVDPTTGEKLPYAGEPGAAPDAPPRAEGAPAGGPDDIGAMLDSIIPERDLKPLADEADQILAEEGAPEGEGAPAEGEAGPEVDVTPIAEKLGIDEAAAMELWTAAQSMPQTADLTPDELADRLVDDFDLRMQLEKLAAGGSDLAAEDAMVAEGMAVPEAGPPVGPPPGELPPM